MYRDMPSFSYVTLYILSINIVHKTATERSSHWKLNDGKVSALASAEPASDDLLFSMLTNKMDMSNGEWSVTDPQSNTCTNSCKTSSNENLPLSYVLFFKTYSNYVYQFCTYAHIWEGSSGGVVINKPTISISNWFVPC